MKIKNLFALFIISLALNSCEIVQEIKFNEDGSGKYALGFDMSEMMKMGGSSKSDSTNQQMDTLIVFSEVLEAKKDSIAKLSKEAQKKIAFLKDFELYIKSDSVSKQLKMNIGYHFKDIQDLERFNEKLEGQNIKELDIFSSKIKPKSDNKKEGFPNFNEDYATTFSRKKFTRKITAEGLEKALIKKDTTLNKDNPTSDMIRFKQRYLFPYKIKSVSNKNIKILSDFKGVELEANMYDLNYNPKYFDVEIEFEN